MRVWERVDERRKNNKTAQLAYLIIGNRHTIYRTASKIGIIRLYHVVSQHYTLDKVKAFCALSVHKSILTTHSAFDVKSNGESESESESKRVCVQKRWQKSNVTLDWEDKGRLVGRSFRASFSNTHTLSCMPYDTLSVTDSSMAKWFFAHSITLDRHSESEIEKCFSAFTMELPSNVVA